MFLLYQLSFHVPEIVLNKVVSTQKQYSCEDEYRNTGRLYSHKVYTKNSPQILLYIYPKYLGLDQTWIETLLPYARDTNRIDFYNPLTKNDTLINPKIYDGDIIFVPKAINQIDSDLRSFTTSNLSAPSITVNIIGEVTQPGQYNLSSDTPINHAILFAGGFTARANKNFVKLVRLRDNGTILSENYKYILDSDRSSKENPALRDKDVLIVTTNAYNKLGDTLNNALTPLNPIIKAARIYSLLD